MKKFMFLAMFAALAIPHATQAELTHHWTFDEGSGATATDSAGTEDGAINGATWATDTGDRASYLNFDGIDDNVDPSLALTQWTPSNAESWSAWVRTTTAKNNAIIIGNRQDAESPYPNDSNRLFAKMTRRDDANGRFVFNDGDAIQMNFSAGGRTEVLPLNEWYHLAIVRDGAGFTFYVDGTAYSNSSYTVPLDNMPTAAIPFFMGGEPDAPGSEHFAGGLDDVRIYDHALSAAEVLALATGDTQVLGDFDGDGDVDCDDLDGYVGNINAPATGALAALDFDTDGTISAADADSVITTLVVAGGVAGTFPGDFNCDGSVNVLGDAFTLVGSLGQNVTSYSSGDATFDGIVNVLGDAFTLVGNLGETNQ